MSEEFPPRISLAFIAIRRVRFSSFQIEFRRGKLFAPDIKLIFWESVCLLAIHRCQVELGEKLGQETTLSGCDNKSKRDSRYMARAINAL